MGRLCDVRDFVQVLAELLNLDRKLRAGRGDCVFDLVVIGVKVLHLDTVRFFPLVEFELCSLFHENTPEKNISELASYLERDVWRRVASFQTQKKKILHKGAGKGKTVLKKEVL